MLRDQIAILRIRSSRRQFIGMTLGSGSSLLLMGCEGDTPVRFVREGGTGCSRDTDFDDGTMLGLARFVGEDDLPLDTTLGDGLDGRLYTDLSVVDDAHRLIENESFYVRTRLPDLIDRSNDWNVTINGLATSPGNMTAAEIDAMAEPMGAHLLECSGNARSGHFGLMSAAEWDGVLLSELLDAAGPHARATRILVSGFDEHSAPSAGGHSTPGASWIFSLSDVRSTGAFLATKMNDAPLPDDHGAPVRLVVPGWYGCTCIKWVNEVRLVDDDVAATSQMKEFASRTHQSAAHELARDYSPAAVQPSAMPVRVEMWSVSGRMLYRVVGILWGDTTETNGLQIKFGSGPWEDVAVCEPRNDTRTWTLWAHTWSPRSTGTFPIVLRYDNLDVQSIRLDRSYYLREVEILRV